MSSCRCHIVSALFRAGRGVRRGFRSFRLSAFAAGLLLSSCGSHTYTPEFLTDSTLRFEAGRQRVFAFTPADCQYTYNLQNCVFRAHTDNMSAFYSVSLASLPTAEGEMIVADLLWSGARGFEERKEIALEVVKLEGDTAWLWFSPESLRMTVRFE